MSVKRSFATHLIPRIAPQLRCSRNPPNIRNPLIYCVNRYFLIFGVSQAQKPYRASTNSFLIFWHWYHVYREYGQNTIHLFKVDAIWHGIFHANRRNILPSWLSTTTKQLGPPQLSFRRQWILCNSSYAFGIIIAAIIYAQIPAPPKQVRITQARRTRVGSISKYSAIPPHTPHSIQFTVDLYKRLLLIINSSDLTFLSYFLSIT